jgi:NADPH-dependent 2,4-dienoyl-CoA reductase/sulfur reductase-like enzyme
MPKTSVPDRPQVLVLGTGFAGYHCLRRLERRLPAEAAEVIAVNPADYMLYVPLLPDVTGGVLEPHRLVIACGGAGRTADLRSGRSRLHRHRGGSAGSAADCADGVSTSGSGRR